MMLALIFGGAGLGMVIAVSGALPLFSGLWAPRGAAAGVAVLVLEGGVTRPRAMTIVPTAG